MRLSRRSLVAKLAEMKSFFRRLDKMLAGDLVCVVRLGPKTRERVLPIVPAHRVPNENSEPHLVSVRCPNGIA